MQEIVEKEKCTGCGACLNVCPKSAISMNIDTEGFEYPLISQSLCIDCGMCQNVCPVIHSSEKYAKRIKENSIQRAFAARNIEYDTLYLFFVL